MSTLIKLRRDTAANWAATDPVLSLGEPGYDTTNNELRIGDGTSAWSSLTPIAGGGGGSYGNANVVSLLASFGSNTISTTGDVTVGNLVGSTPNNSGSLQWIGNSSGDGYGYTTMVLRPDDTVSSDQSIVLDPTAPNHIHIRAGGTQDDSSASLFLGGENSAFLVPAGLDPSLYIIANTYQWSFANNGTTTFPTLTVDLHNGGNQSAQTLQFGDTTQQAIITGPTPEVDTNAQRIIIQGQRGNGTGEGGDVYLWGGDADTNGGDIKIYAGNADNVSAGSGGYVNIEGGSGFDFGGYVSIQGGQSNNGQGAPASVIGGYGVSGGDANVVGGQGYAGTGGAVNITGGASGNGLAEYGNVNIGAGASTWTFDNTGNVTVPADGYINTATGSHGDINFHPDGNGKVVITGNTSGPLLQVIGDEPNSYNRIEIDTFGNGAVQLGGTFSGRFNRGTFAVPEAVLDSDRLAQLTGSGYDGSDFTLATGRITYEAVGNWSGSNHGTRISFYTTPLNSTTLQLSARIYSTGDYHQIIGNVVVESGIVITNTYTVSSLPSATVGARSFVTDADTRTWGNLAVGGAGNTVPVWSDGSSWYIG